MKTKAMLFVILTLPRIAFAAWPTTPAGPPVAVSSERYDQQNAIVTPDGLGGTFVMWNDARYDGLNADLYMQRLDRDGNPLWMQDGIQIPFSYPFSDFGETPGEGTLVPDGTGGTWVAYKSDGQLNLYAHVSAGGFFGGGQNLRPGPPLNSLLPRGVSDGAGGAFFLASINGVGTNDTLYAQYITANGSLPWGESGRNLFIGPCNSADLVADGHGGIFACWLNGSGIGAQHLTANGTPLWAAAGVQAVTITGPVQPRMALTGNDEVMIGWTDPRTSASDLDLFVQRLDAQGVSRFGATGFPVCVATSSPRFPSNASATSIVGDGNGGAYLVWDDFRLGSSNLDVYAQHVNAAGSRLWAVNGKAVGNAGGNQGESVIATDDAGGAYICWSDFRAGSPGIYGQRLDAAGNELWSPGGTQLSTVQGGVPSIARDASGFVVSFQELVVQNSNYYYDERAVRADHWGKLGRPEPVITSITDVPGDQGGVVTLNWNRSYVDNPPGSQLLGYLVWREVPGASLAANARILADPDDAPGTTESGPLYVARTENGTTTYWEYLGTTASNGSATYSVNEPTTADAPVTSRFFVSARSFSIPTQHWDSDPAAGSSVDNTPPAAPLTFVASYENGTAYLRWTSSPDPDVAAYDIYRSTSPALMAKGNQAQLDPTYVLIATVNDTLYVDPIGAVYSYRVATVDVHGNESPPVGVVPGPVGVGGPSTAVFAFAAPRPNPAVGGPVTLSFSLPHPGRVRIALYDPRGRRVTTVLDEVRPAGEQVARLDPRGRLASGVYLLRLESEAGTIDRSMVVLR